MRKCTLLIAYLIIIPLVLSILGFNPLYASSNKKGSNPNVINQQKSENSPLSPEVNTEQGSQIETTKKAEGNNVNNLENNRTDATTNNSNQGQQVQSNFFAPYPNNEEKVEKMGEIKGRVLDVKSRPINGVTVKCYNENGVLIQETETDNNGKYIFKDLPKGKYRIVIEYQPSKKQIDLKGEKTVKRPPIPTGLNIYELNYNIPGKDFIRVEWDQMQNANEYKCELLDRQTREKISEIDGIKQNYCEFGNLEENKEYMVKVYSKNELGISLSYALGVIKTADKRPPSPYNLGYTYAKNNRIDLVWSGIEVPDIKGYILQIKKEKEKYLYYSTKGLVEKLKYAYLIPYTGSLVKLKISGYDNKSNPIIDNSIPYSFRVFEIDKSNNLSAPSRELNNVVLEDTVPPLPITDIQYKNINDNLIRVSWKTKDRDVVKYRLYYGVNKDRWDGMIVTSKNYYDFAISRKYLPDGKLYVAVIAIDKAGNESGFRPVTQEASIDGKQVEQKIILSETNVYKDLSVAVKALKPVVKKAKTRKVKKVVKKIPPRPKEYGFSYLKTKGFEIDKGETATLSGKIEIPEGIIIKVKSGGKLLLKNLTIETSKSQKLWGGIRYLGGSYGEIRNVTIKSAVRGIVVLDNAKVVDIKNLKIYNSKEEALFISNSNITLMNSTFKNNGLALYIDNSSVKAENIDVNNNDKGILVTGYKFSIKNSVVSGNKSYGLRLSGTVDVSGCTVKNNQVGIFVEKSIGKTKIKDSVISHNRIDGILVESSNVDIMNNDISSNNRYGIYARKGSNPYIVNNNIISNGGYGIFGGGKVIGCYVAFNNGSPYIDETSIKGKIDGIFSSSSSDVIKQIYNVDYIEKLSLSPIVLVK